MVELNRRATLAGIGGLAIGGGALLGTGAFTSVEAERTVQVQTAGDASAFLGLDPVGTFAEQNGDTVEILLDGAAVNASGGGVNENALSVFDGQVQVTNQGGGVVSSLNFDFTYGGTAPSPDTIKVTSGTAELVGDGSSNLLAQSGAGDAGDGQLTASQSVPFGIVVDLLNTADDGTTLDNAAPINLVITADTA
jgi:hypothetical protein